jgi:hypothetical protein
MSDILRNWSADLKERDRDRRTPWHDDPVKFMVECVDWPENQSLTSYQAQMLRDLLRHQRLAARGPHGLGKSALAALLILWFSLTRDAAGYNWKILTTASAWRQLEKFLWPEVHLWAKRIRFELLERAPFDPRTELLTTSLKLEYGAASAGASDDPALLEGAHADSLLVVFDEAKTIPAGTWDALEGALSGTGEALALAVSTPGVPSGTFYDIHSRKPGFEDWHATHVTLEQAIEAGRISPTWVKARERQWGANSAVFQNRALGNFASSDEDSAIPYPHIEAAFERYLALQDITDIPSLPVTYLGVDVASSGQDKTVLALRSGDVVTELRRFSHADTMQTTGRVAAVLNANPDARAIIDVIGIGTGVVDRLREQGFKRITGFNAGTATRKKDRAGELEFENTRSAAWWNLREMLDPAYGATLVLPPDDELIGDLTAPRFSVTSRGRIQIERKEDIKKRIGRSTDAGDAVVQACFASQRGEGDVWKEFWAGQIAKRNQSNDLELEAQQAAREQLRHLPRLGDQGRAKPNPHCAHRWMREENGEVCVSWCHGWRELQ